MIDEKLLRYKTSIRVSNYFKSYSGQKFLQTSNILSHEEMYSKEDKEIIESLIKKGTQVIV